MFARYLPPEYSGAASQALLLANRLRRRGHHIEFVSPSWKGVPWSYQVDGFQVTGVRINLKTIHKEFSVWRALSVYLWQRRNQIDILHSQGAYYTQSIVGPLGLLFGKPSLVKASLANDDLCSLTGSSISAIHRRFLNMIDAYVAISSDLEQEFLDKGLRKEKVQRIPNGVDTDRFHPTTPGQKQTAAIRLGLPTDRRIALFVGVFDHRKRISWLAKRWTATNGFGTGTLLCAVGPTSREPYGNRLRKQLEDMAVAHPNLLKIYSHTDDIAPFYRASDYFVFPSSNEGLPNALLEAMASGLPTIATRVSGSNELVQEGKTGWGFDVDDEESLAHALTQLDGDHCRVMGQQARLVAEKQYCIDTIATRYETLYESLMSKHKGAKPR